ncbi:hypothetical protein J6590_016362 [Homalodisca vitripennis]|nr:hypothetical protein J6590_016362 [Homalodisca vitripennis]
MKVLCALLALLVVAEGVSFFEVVLEEWDLFKLQHNKSYSSDTEERFRMKIFMDNKNKIAKHNSRFEKGEVSFKLAMNHYGDMFHGLTNHNSPAFHTTSFRSTCGRRRYSTSVTLDVFVGQRYKGRVSLASNDLPALSAGENSFGRSSAAILGGGRTIRGFKIPQGTGVSKINALRDCASPQMSEHTGGDESYDCSTEKHQPRAFNTFSNFGSRYSPVRWSPSRRRLHRRCRSITCPLNLSAESSSRAESEVDKNKKAEEQAETDTEILSKVVGRKSRKKHLPQQLKWKKEEE